MHRQRGVYVMCIYLLFDLAALFNMFRSDEANGAKSLKYNRLTINLKEGRAVLSINCPGKALALVAFKIADCELSRISVFVSLSPKWVCCMGVHFHLCVFTSRKSNQAIYQVLGAFGRLRPASANIATQVSQLFVLIFQARKFPSAFPPRNIICATVSVQLY